ncbi:AGAP002950-PA-like protein [Anopheles sinensis]|uniref:AGAP002950-PA-like protein n=1 Tax=Anopheles sinensis TaxID=74873 RepID=A0A084WU86_ANOSI|nr:AGAP002950-PA-like protein [Anopheles sinensis]
MEVEAAGNVQVESDAEPSSNCSSEDEEELISKRVSIFKNLSFEEGLRYWALLSSLPHVWLNLLLELIREKTHFALPKDARTLLHTNRIPATITSTAGGRMWYNGVQRSLEQRSSIVIMPSSISLNISIDGIPLHRSSREAFWPILISINELPKEAPLIVAIYSGQKKPQSMEGFLRCFVDEMNVILANGTTIRGQTIAVAVRCIIADAPARAMVKGAASFNARQGCLKCTALGTKNAVTGAVVFESTNASKRSDEDFRLERYPDHHRTRSPLLDLVNFDMIEDVIVSDRLHLIDLGVMRKLLQGWRAVYEHFLLFYCAITLLSSSVHKRNWVQAGQMLIQFVSKFNDVYSEGYVTSNVHNLVHVYDEVAKFGALGSLSAYPFENELQHIKNMLRNGYKGCNR